MFRRSRNIKAHQPIAAAVDNRGDSLSDTSHVDPLVVVGKVICTVCTVCSSHLEAMSVDDDGFPFVTHLPLKLEEEGGQPVRLLGHCARGNPLARYLTKRPEALASFMGPQAYMSPKVYPDLTRVPTWSYLAVHAKVEATLVEGDKAKDHLLKQLIGDHEPPYATQWRGLAEDYQSKMLNAIVLPTNM